jgi:hypothetical protein
MFGLHKSYLQVAFLNGKGKVLKKTPDTSSEGSLIASAHLITAVT